MSEDLTVSLWNQELDKQKIAKVVQQFGTDEEYRIYLKKAEEDLIYMMAKNIESLWKYEILNKCQTNIAIKKLRKKAEKLGIWISIRDV